MNYCKNFTYRRLFLIRNSHDKRKTTVFCLHVKVHVYDSKKITWKPLNTRDLMSVPAQGNIDVRDVFE